MKLEIQDPGEAYRGSRFDWTARVIQVTLDGRHTFCTGESENPLYLNSGGRGFCNEFGIDQAIGYNECLPCERFHKIGVGLLKKLEEQVYSFSKDYDLLPVHIERKLFHNKIVYQINSPIANGFAYLLDKTLRLDGPAFILNYELKNTGKKPIRTTEYVHNFLKLNNRKIDSSYLLSFPFNIEPVGFYETVNPMERVYFDQDTVHWNSQVEQPFFFSHLNQNNISNRSWGLINKEEKIGLKETCSAVSMVNLWGDKHVVSPELFHPINLMPGEKDDWERKFEFFQI